MTAAVCPSTSTSRLSQPCLLDGIWPRVCALWVPPAATTRKVLVNFPMAVSSAVHTAWLFVGSAAVTIVSWTRTWTRTQASTRTSMKRKTTPQYALGACAWNNRLRAASLLASNYPPFAASRRGEAPAAHSRASSVPRLQQSLQQNYSFAGILGCDPHGQLPLPLSPFPQLAKTQEPTICEVD